MGKKFLRGLAGLIGVGIGYGFCRLLFLLIGYFAGEHWLEPKIQTIIAAAFAVLFGIIIFVTAPAWERQIARLSNRIGKELQKVSAGTIIGMTIGLIAGLLIAFLVAQIFVIIRNEYLHLILMAVDYILFIYLGLVVGIKKGADLDRFLASKKSGEKHITKPDRKNRSTSPKILDTSVIIDGRIADILDTGFLEGTVVIPDFVLVELRHIADSSDSLKRTRGRQGLDVLNKIREKHGVEIFESDDTPELQGIPEVDVKLLKLGEIMKGKVVTNDFNLNKVAGINGVSVLNINDLANALKPVMLPGETMSLDLIKPGTEANQAVGYLDDGTMIVVENGRKMIGKRVTIRVTSVLQTSAGRMIFGRIRDNDL